MKKILLFAVVATMFAACSKDTTEDIGIVSAPDKLHVSIAADDSRIQLDDNCRTVWNEGDQVSVFNKTNSNERWQFDGQTGDRSGTLSKVGGNSGTKTDKVIALYPYDPKCAVSGNMISTTIPDTQIYKADSFGEGGNIMVAVSDNNDLSFKNIFGWIRLSLTDFDTRKVKSIVFSGNNGEKLTGDATIDTDTYSVHLGDDSVASVVLDCGEGVQLSATTPAYFYIAVVPQTFEQGVKITVVYTDNSVFEKSTEKPVAIIRNHIATITQHTPEIPNNQIWYTTDDGKPLNIYPYGFGANLISDIYKNGQGIIQFDGDITSIPDFTFSSERLTSIIIPDSVVSIGEGAFFECGNLVNLYIGSGVTFIGGSAFSGCTSLMNVTIPANVTSIGNQAFRDCHGECIINCNIPNYTDAYRDSCFSYSKFTKITISDGVTSIGDYAFYGCKEITDVTIGRSVKSIGKMAFGFCENLTSIYLPDSVVSIGDKAFYSCTCLIDVNIPDSVVSIGEWAFGNCSLSSIAIPNSVESIGDSAFYGCSNLTSVYITDIVKWCTIKGTLAFPCAYNLYLNGALVEDLIIPDSVATIGDYAFYNCNSLKSVIINDNITSIGDWAFAYCDNLTDITFGKKIEYIKKSVLSNDYNIITISSKAVTPPTMEQYTFIFWYKWIVYVPIGCKTAYAEAPEWKYAKSIEEVEF